MASGSLASACYTARRAAQASMRVVPRPRGASTKGGHVGHVWGRAPLAVHAPPRACDLSKFDQKAALITKELTARRSPEIEKSHKL
jgi:hypothetical protein